MKPTEAAIGSEDLEAQVDGTTRWRVALAAGVGNFLEWFDFGLYGFLAVTIGQLFFPTTNATSSLLAALAVFGVAFLFRPLGGLVLGPFADRAGRKTALSVCIVLMGLCTTLIGLLPTYSTIGIAAPILLILLRCGQGFSAGGEYAGAAAFLIEYAPKGKRGVWSSVISATAGLGVVSGGIVTLALTAGLSPEALASWGWRLPFLAAGPVALIGLYVRLRMDETPTFRGLELAHHVAKSPLKETVRLSRKSIGLIFACTAVAGLGFYNLATYILTYLTVTVGVPRTLALLISAPGLLIYAAMCPFAGRIGDRFGRRRTMLAGTAGLTLFSIPAFTMISSGNPALVLAAMIPLAFFEALANVMLGVLMVELFPPRTRVTGSALGFNTAQALIGGQGPLVAAYLAATIPLVFAPAFYIVGVCAIAFVVLYRFLPETVGAVLGEVTHVATPAPEPQPAEIRPRR